ncbi:ABC transporter permease [Thomasclavelia saccharogumia]|uniref:ABC transporter permease n=1 Tax=Thomasclavelia saccharogumia TaxID=341225 RepID=UPI00047C4AA3|nr:ABC transporter permease [Thomasclavelia saccharogumia]
MTVFKKYLKIANTYTLLIIIYTAIFLGLAIFAGTYNSSTTEYKSVDIKVAVINRDEDSNLIKGLKKYIQDSGKLINLDDQEEKLRDALFYRTVDYIMIIPKNYTSDFISGKNVQIETMELPDSYNSIYSKNLLNKYLNTANLYLKAGISDQKLTKLIKEDLSKNIEVSMLEKKNDIDFTKAATYYNFSNYMLITITMVIVTMIMVSFNEEKIKHRNLVSPVSYKSMNRQLLLGNYTVGLFIWLLYVIFSFILYSKAMMTINGLLLIINSLVLMLFIQALSFMIAKFTSNREILSGVGNVFGLGSSFICGAFVPQSMLSPFVLTLAKFLPSYWFIKANNEIVKLNDFGFEAIKPVLIDMLIVCGFTLLVYLETQIITKIRLKK